MNNPSIYNQNGQIVTNQTFTTGESNNKVASTKFVVDTANLIVNNFKTITENSLSQIVNNSLVFESTIDASFTKLLDGTVAVGKATNLTGDTGNNRIPYNNGSTTQYIGQPSPSTVLTYQSGSFAWTDLGVLDARHVRGGVKGELLVQNGSDTTFKLPVGTSGYLLQTDGSGNLPSWKNPGELNVSSAGKATSIFGGAPGVIPYQDASGSTKFTAVGTSGYLLKSNGNGAPSWVRIGDLVDNSFDLVNVSLASKADKELVDSLFDSVNDRIDVLIGLDATLPSTLNELKDIVDYIEDTSANLLQRIVNFDNSVSSLESSLALKSNKGLVDASFGLVNDSLALKADKGLVDISLNLKADKTAVAVSLLSFPSKNAVDISLNLKADLLYVDASFNVTSGSIIFPSASQGYATWDLSNTNTLVFSGGVQGGIYNILVTAGVNPSIIRNGIKFSTNSVTSLDASRTYLLTVTKISSTYCCNLVECN